MSRKRGSRDVIRGVLIFLIVATIPFYLCAIVFFLLSPDPAAPTATPTLTERVTNTPIDPFAGTRTTTVSASRLPTVRPTSTLEFFQPITFTPLPTIAVFTPVSPTASATPTPTAIPPTPVPQPTVPPQPTATEPILLPPSDTPAP